MNTKNTTLILLLSFFFAKSFSQVVYTDVNPDLTFSMDQMYILDMDNDSNPDYIIEQVDSVITGNPLEGVQLRHFPSTNNEAIYESGALTFLHGMALGDLIDPTELWTVPNPSLPAGGVIMVGSTPYPAGDWSDGLEHYAGLRFITNTNVYYGWVRFTVTVDGLGFTIMDYAYHSTPDQPLLAGATVDGVEEAELSGVEWNISGGFLLLNNTNPVETVSEIYDISGKLMATHTWKESGSIDLSVFANGIYLMCSSNENGSSAARFSVNR